MTDINELVERLSLAYLLARGNTFNHLGVQLPLNQEVLTMAIRSQIVGAHLEHAGGKQIDGRNFRMAREALVEPLDQRESRRVLAAAARRLGQPQKLRRLFGRKCRNRRRFTRLHLAIQIERLLAPPFLQKQGEVAARMRRGALFTSGEQQELVVTAVRCQVVRRRALRLVGLQVAVRRLQQRCRLPGGK